jgi:mannose-6-phosphate isomerase-like protein (cupin superfamily)
MAMILEDSRIDIVEAVRTNDWFRRELITGAYEQVVLMTIPVGGEIGDEVHPDTDQVLLFEEGVARAVLGGRVSTVGPGDLLFVRAGTRHNVENAGGVPLRLVSIYAPPHHAPGTVHRTKEDADAAE